MTPSNQILNYHQITCSFLIKCQIKILDDKGYQNRLIKIIVVAECNGKLSGYVTRRLRRLRRGYCKNTIASFFLECTSLLPMKRKMINETESLKI